jgi:hypothetical protein
MTPAELRTLMQSRGWSTTDVASLLPCNPRTIQRYLSGQLEIRKAIARSITALTPESQPVKRNKATKVKS